MSSAVLPIAARRHHVVTALARGLETACGTRDLGPVVLGVSGGVDSTAMLLATSVLVERPEWRIQPIPVHVNHHLREDADLDAAVGGGGPVKGHLAAASHEAPDVVHLVPVEAGRVRVAVKNAQLVETLRGALLSDGGDGVGPRLAREALAPPKPRPQPVPGQGVRGFPQIQLQIQGGAQAIKIRNVNGVKDIEVTEKERSIKIHDDPNQGIKVEITETKDGKPVTRKFEAKNADELKKKHPEAHKLYQQYSQGAAGNIQLRINGQVPGNGIPRIQIAPFKIPIPANPRQVPGNAKRITDLRLQQLERMIQSIQKQLELAGEDAGPTKQSLEHLKKALEEIKQAREKLGEDRPET